MKKFVWFLVLAAAVAAFSGCGKAKDLINGSDDNSGSDVNTSFNHNLPPIQPSGVDTSAYADTYIASNSDTVLRAIVSTTGGIALLIVNTDGDQFVGAGAVSAQGVITGWNVYDSTNSSIATLTSPAQISATNGFTVTFDTDSLSTPKRTFTFAPAASSYANIYKGEALSSSTKVVDLYFGVDNSGVLHGYAKDSQDSSISAINGTVDLNTGALSATSADGTQITGTVTSGTWHNSTSGNYTAAPF